MQINTRVDTPKQRKQTPENFPANVPVALRYCSAEIDYLLLREH
ncbi:hypothetical protein HMPREF1584_01361 [Gardnerella vaginalis JCP8481A]|uniref:Uncharacterized protein n=1 Tax=Gardnerella vaginalis TaxID=2702 RepID=A0A133NPA7_GARVA|nr:hypothetical protein HMPREF1584_01361 [Gardnerella vaginalis JCP8481A]EPI42190.1 hypothetical protein HMPREF1585_01025 [Gardnerella vaginalis JCP8481B]KXA18132.1 hypothetical protein HMPREF3208_01401 [Gardnerella vaginalis]